MFNLNLPQKLPKSANYPDMLNDPAVQALFNGIDPNFTVKDKQNNSIDKDTLIQAIIDSLFSQHPDNALVSEIQQLMIDQLKLDKEAKGYPIENYWLINNLLHMALPLPNDHIRYLAKTDIVPAAKDWLKHPNQLSSNKLIDVIGAYLLNSGMLNTMQIIVVKDWPYLIKYLNSFKPSTDPTINKYIQQFQKIINSLTANNPSTTIILNPNIYDEDNFTNHLYRFFADLQAGVMKDQLIFSYHSIRQFILPQNFLIYSAKNLSTITDEKEFSQDANKIVTALNKSRQFLKYSRFDEIKSAEIAQNANRSSSFDQRGFGVGNSRLRSDRHMIKDKKLRIQSSRQAAFIRYLLKNKFANYVTSNPYKQSHKTYMRPNRRHPDDLNLAGRMNVTKYKLGVHVYLDCSGSIDERQSMIAMLAISKMAKLMGSALSFTSFSDHISQTTDIPVSGKTPAQIIHMIDKVPKVGGGTEFENVWNMIDLRASQKHVEVNFVITDLEYSLRYDRRFIPQKASSKLTYYFPLSVGTDNSSIQYAKELTKNFEKNMFAHGCKNIKSHIADIF